MNDNKQDLLHFLAQNGGENANLIKIRVQQDLDRLRHELDQNQK